MTIIDVHGFPFSFSDSVGHGFTVKKRDAAIGPPSKIT